MAVVDSRMNEEITIWTDIGGAYVFKVLEKNSMGTDFYCPALGMTLRRWEITLENGERIDTYWAYQGVPFAGSRRFESRGRGLGIKSAERAVISCLRKRRKENRRIVENDRLVGERRAPADDQAHD